jgi:hypothetical protein
MQRSALKHFRVVALMAGAAVLGFDSFADSPAALLPAQLAIEDHLREWPELTSTARDRASRDLSATDMALVQNKLDAAYSDERLQLEIEQAILSDASPKQLLALSQVADSPAFARHRERIEHQRGRDGLRVQPIHMGEVMKTGPDRRRLTAIGRMSAATGKSENLLMLAASIGESIARAQRGLSCETPAAADRAVEQVRRDIASASRRFASYDLHLLNLSYWDASQEQIEETIEVMESPQMRWLHERLRLHLGEALLRSEVEFAAGVAQLRDERCPAQ